MAVLGTWGDSNQDPHDYGNAECTGYPKNEGNFGLEYVERSITVNAQDQAKKLNPGQNIIAQPTQVVASKS